MRLFIEMFKLQLLQSFRQPSYVLSTLIFPSLFFLFFAQPNAKSAESAYLLMGSFSAFAVLSSVFLQYGVKISVEEKTAWNQYLKTLPISSWTIYLSQALVVFCISLLASIMVVAVVIYSTPAEVRWTPIFLMFSLLAVGSFPFSFLAASIGKVSSEASALASINLIYLTLSFAGGLWMPPSALPEIVAEVSVYLPTRCFGEIIWWTLLDDYDLKESYVYGFIAYTFIFFVLYRFVSRRVA